MLMDEAKNRIALLEHELADAKNQNRMLHTFINNTEAGIYVTDYHTGEVLYANRKMATIGGGDFNAEQLIGNTCWTMINVGGEGRCPFCPFEKLLNKDGTPTEPYVWEQFFPDYNLFLKIISQVIVWVDGRLAQMNTFFDISETKRMQENAEKERGANLLKNNFLSNMSHEIRTPMNAIIGLTQIELNKKNSMDSHEVIKKINVSAKSLLQIVNDILDLSKVEANKMELFPEEFELDDVLSSVLLIISPHLEGKRVELLLDTSPDLPKFLIGDRTRLWQIIKNCLDNAAKFTQEGSIVLTVTKERSTEDSVFISFSIADTGIGMSESQLQRLFIPYEQNHSFLHRNSAGTGLGMSIAKQICELMGGVLEVESTPGKGTAIRFTIPFERVKNSNTEEPSTDTLSGLRVLVVDNNLLFLEFIGKILKNNGAVCTFASSGAEALQVVMKQQDETQPPFDVILLDYVMDDMNGFETAKQIRKAASDYSKILMVTAFEYRLSNRQLEECGIIDVIEKPFSPTVFVQKIRIALGLEERPSDIFERAYAQFTDVNVLVCEDNEINQEVVVEMLKQFGINATPAYDGREGLAALDNNGPFDLILMDLHMPVMDGFEATRTIRRDPRFAGIPIISLTADAMSDVQSQCLGAGMSDYLAKPFEMEKLHEILCKWIPKYKLPH